MKVIITNDVEIEKNPKLGVRKTARELVKKLVRIDDEYVQYVKAEKTENLIECKIHPFVKAVHLAFGQHLPLVITPDAIWYLISSGVAAHVNANAEELRSKFVDHEGKETIKVRRDDFVLGSLTNPWHEVIDEFCVKVGKFTKNEIADLIQADFSTTTKDARVASQIVLMDAMSKYLEYEMNSLCGIPEIRVSGDRSDWEKLAEKTKKIVSIVPELQRWMDSGLTEILDNFIAIFDDKVDKDFWNSIYKAKMVSGGPYITGWIIALFPYLIDGKQNYYVWGHRANWKDSIKQKGVTTSSFDYHMNQVPFTWEYMGKEIEMLFIGGMVGISASKGDNALEPVFGYAVTENKINKNEGPDKYNIY